MGSQIGSLDAATTGQIFRRDFPMVLACNRHQALLLPVRIMWESAAATGLVAGTVLARNTGSGFYQRYDSGGASGLDVAACVLFASVIPPASGTDMGIGIFEGKVYENKLVGLDAGAKTDLGARSIIDGSGDQILIF